VEIQISRGKCAYFETISLMLLSDSDLGTLMAMLSKLISSASRSSVSGL
jgi:hypothetical protein